MIEGKDVSSHQPDFSPAATDDFVFIKASQGTSYRNSDAAAQVKRARVGGRTIGWYHWLEPGNIVTQAHYFAGSPGIEDGDPLVCDWEGKVLPSCAEKDQFIRAVKALRPHSRVGLYCNTYTWNKFSTSKYRGDFLQIADYNAPVPSSPWTIWQYSDGNGQLDHDRASFSSRAAMKTWADGLLPKPEPKPPAGLWISGKRYTPLRYVSVFWTNAARAAKGRYVSRHVFYCQVALAHLGHYTAALDGRWGPATQASYDRYRRSLGLKGADAAGSAGLSSLQRLMSAGKVTLPVKVK